MKVLLFEYISGGGFNRQTLPAALAAEGQLMLQALLDNFAVIKDISVSVMLDSRFVGALGTGNAEVAIIAEEHDYYSQFLMLAQTCDAVWPIAPESDGLLQGLCQAVTGLGKVLLTSPASVVGLAGNKYLTYQHLCRHHIPTVPTCLLSQAAGYGQGEWMVKAIDGVGCADSYIVSNASDHQKAYANPNQYIIQPHLQGRKISLSCLFKQGQAWLLSVNLQQFDVVDRQYQLVSIIVNQQPDTGAYENLAKDIAMALPGLWGYAGIDLIETHGQLLVLEINPRLTTSFTGIDKALGINVAEQVLLLQYGGPDFRAKRNIPITISL